VGRGPGTVTPGALAAGTGTQDAATVSTSGQGAAGAGAVTLPERPPGPACPAVVRGYPGTLGDVAARRGEVTVDTFTGHPVAGGVPGPGAVRWPDGLLPAGSAGLPEPAAVPAGPQHQAGPRTPGRVSVWQQSLSAWQAAGVRWHPEAGFPPDDTRGQPAGEPGPAVTASRQATKTRAVPGPAGPALAPSRGSPGPGPGPALAAVPGERAPARPKTAAGKPRRRWRAAAAAAGAVLLLAAGAAADIAALGAGRGHELAGSRPGQRGQQPGLAALHLPSRYAETVPAVPPGVSGGVPPRLTAVAVTGHTIVAAGSELSAAGPRPVFLVSADGGLTWQRAAVAGSGTRGAAGAAPRLLAGGPAGWLALAPGFAWRSAAGWQWWPSAGIAPPGSGDHVTALTVTGSGFLAVGDHTSRTGRRVIRSPVLWTSAGGLVWRRRGAGELHLAGGRGTVVGLRYAAARGRDLVVGGEIVRTARQSGGHRVVRAGLWRSTDGGASWRRVVLPARHGATRWLAGLATTGHGFVAVRPGRARSGRRDAVVYLSASGRAWRFAGRLASGRAGLTVTMVTGNSHGVAAVGSSGSRRAVFASKDGRAWREAGVLGPARLRVVTGAAAGPAGHLVVAVTRRGRALGAGRPELLLAQGKSRARPVGALSLSAAASLALAVNGLAVGHGQQVAVGSAGGAPAVWRTGPAGQWSPAAVTGLASGLASGSRLAGAGLASAVSGRAGWLAVGRAGGLGEPTGPLSPAKPRRLPAGRGRSARATSEPGPLRPVVMVSATGASWHPAPGTAALTAPGVTLTQAAAGPRGYVVVGSRLAGSRLAAAAWFSASLRAWTAARPASAGALAGPGSRQMLAAAGTGAGFVAAGQAGRQPAVWISADGSRWRLDRLPLPPGAARAALTSVAVRGARLVAAGTVTPAAAARHGCAPPVLAVSADGGATWRESRLPLPGTLPAGPVRVTALTVASGGFVAAGVAGDPGWQAVVVWWSAGGLTWHAATPSAGELAGPGTHEITALSVFGDSLTVAGYSATRTGVQPLLGRARLG
jgi:hypothetical protein